MVDNLAAIRDAVAQGAALAESFMVCTGTFYQDGNSTPLFSCKGRVKIPRPSVFDAGNQTVWDTKRRVVFSIPIAADGVPDVIPNGLIVQITGADDPAINNINFTVMSVLGQTFAATREVSLETQVAATPRIV